MNHTLAFLSLLFVPAVLMADVSMDVSIKIKDINTTSKTVISTISKTVVVPDNGVANFQVNDLSVSLHILSTDDQGVTFKMVVRDNDDIISRSVLVTPYNKEAVFRMGEGSPENEEDLVVVKVTPSKIDTSKTDS